MAIKTSIALTTIVVYIAAPFVAASQNVPTCPMSNNTTVTRSVCNEHEAEAVEEWLAGAMQFELLQKQKERRNTRKEENARAEVTSQGEQLDPTLEQAATSGMTIWEKLKQDPDIPAPYIECVKNVISELWELDLDDNGRPCAILHVCGSMADDAPQMRFMMKRALESTVNTVCETGFYRGESAAMWLCSKPELRMHSFDLEFGTAELAVLQRHFGDRLTTYLGDSTETLPHFASNTSVCCDISIADGGHEGDVPLSDLENFVRAAEKDICKAKPTLLVMDEVMYPSDTFTTTQAWSEASENGLVNSGSCCQLETRGYFCHGFSPHSLTPTTNPYYC